MSLILTWMLHGTVLAAIATLPIAAVSRRTTAATRYSLWWAVLAAVLAIPAAHALTTPAAPAAIAVANPAIASLHAATPSLVAPDSRPLLVLPEGASVAAPWLATLLLCVVGWRLIALAHAASRLRRVRARCAPLPGDVEAQLPMWRAVRGRGRAPQLRLTLDLSTPAVLGPLDRDEAPIIALPLWTIETLDAESLDLIVLHELAHVERRDDRDLLVQAAIEAVFGWHPAIWWAGRRLDAERERACDDMVVARTNRASQYARCLVGVAAQAGSGPALLAAPGAGRAGRRLAQRVERLLADRPVAPRLRSRSLRAAWSVVTAALLVSAVTVSAAGAPRIHVAETTWDRIAASSMLLIDAPADAGSLLVRPSAVQAPPASSAVRVEAGQSPRAVSRVTRPDSAAPSMPIAPPVDAPEAVVAAPVSAVGPPAPDHSELAGGLLSATPVAHSFMLTAPSPAVSPAPPPAAEASPWRRTADAGESIGKGAAQTGESIGKGASRAGVKTAGFFSRMGKAVARSF